MLVFGWIEGNVPRELRRASAEVKREDEETRLRWLIDETPSCLACADVHRVLPGRERVEERVEAGGLSNLA